jgi:hypothetical protein
MLEYRGTLRDGTILGFSSTRCEALERAHELTRSSEETDYEYRLRVLRKLTAKDIVSWELVPFHAPVYHAPGMFASGDSYSEGWPLLRIGVILLLLASLGFLLLSVFSV